MLPKKQEPEKLKFRLTDKARTTVDLSNKGERMPQQLVYEETGLAAGKHFIKIIKRDGGKVAVDAIVVK